MVHRVKLAWPGRSWTVGNATRNTHPPRVVEVVGDGAHRIVQGDVLDVAPGLSDRVELVYVDPPYASDRDYTAEARLDGPADGRVVRTKAYGDKWDADGAYLEMLAPRLEALCNLLSDTGTIWVHLDWRSAYVVRVVLEEILGRDCFMNEIVWRRAPNLGRQAASGQFGRTLDTILVYGKTERASIKHHPTRLEPIEPNAIRWDDEGRPFTSAPRGDYTDASIAKLDKEGRVHRTASGRVYIKYFLVKNDEGVLCRERRVDALWTDVAPLRHAAASERTGYPTQKPRALLERIIRCATNPGDLVVDGFAGSGTTGVAAHALGRRAILCDTSPVAMANARARMLREGAGVRIERVGAAPPASGPRVRVENKKGLVRLVEPEEPLAWAVGTEEMGVFRCAWHGERMPGTKPRPAPREADVSALGKRVPLRVRVWGDDGSVGEASP